MSKSRLRRGFIATAAGLALLSAVFSGTSINAPAATAVPISAEKYGPFGPEGPRMREQFWVLPSGDAKRTLRATVFRPDEPEGAEGQVPLRRPVVVINHGTSEATRLAVAMPVYYWLSRWFVERGYVVVLPQRRGHGATGGALSEAIGNCANPDHFQSGLAAADDISAVVSYLQTQPFVDAANIVVAGISTGGWASLAYASRNPQGVRAVVNFAGGRGGHAGGLRNAICAQQRLVDSVATYGHEARVPTVWFYSENDSYFGPQLARSMAKAWSVSGGSAELHMLPAYGEEGHNIADDRAGWDLWGAELDGFLQSLRGVEHEKVAAAQPPQAAQQAEMPRASPAAFTPATQAGVMLDR